MKRQSLVAFSAGYLLASMVALRYIKQVETQNKKRSKDFKRLYEHGVTLLNIVEEIRPELLDDPRLEKLAIEDEFENVVKDF